MTVPTVGPDPDWVPVREALLDAETLVRAVGSGQQRGASAPWRRVELRYIDLAAGRRLQVTAYDDTQAHTSNHTDAAAAVDGLLGDGYANWHVETTARTLQVRVTKKGKVLVHAGPPSGLAPSRDHDRVKDRVVPATAPYLRALGIADADGRIKPSRQAKLRQIEEFVRDLSTALDDAWASGSLRTPTREDPLRFVDLGCGNAYLTFAAQHHLAARAVPSYFIGVDVKEQSSAHNAAVAAELGLSGEMEFVVGTIDGVALDATPDVVLALHACDTATDDALARGVGWAAPLVLAAPCCHHDIARQLRDVGAPAPYDLLVRDGILRERLADTLTDGLRAARMRAEGYRVDVIEFVPSKHTPRNTLLRAVRTGSRGSRDEYDALVGAWGLRPRLGEKLSS
ncbi:MAG TPA: SAM-dependent methyltransferase [Marmoricola sp.]